MTESLSTVSRIIAMPVGLACGCALGIAASRAHLGAGPTVAAGLAIFLTGVGLRMAVLAHRNLEERVWPPVGALAVAGVGLGLIVLGLAPQAS